MKLYLITFFSIFISANILAQNDTIWYDSSWKTTTKTKADFFRPPPKKTGDLYLLKDYRVNGKLQMEGFSKQLDKDVFEGMIIWYNEDGSISRKSNYKDNVLHGKFITYVDGKEYVVIYKDNVITDGVKAYKTYFTKDLIYFKDGKETKRLSYFTNHKNRLRKEVYYSTKEKEHNPILKKFYNKKGVLLGELTFDGYKPKDGINVYFHNRESTYDEVSTIEHYKNSKNMYTDYFYNNGQARVKNVFSPDRVTTFYKKDGEVLGVLKYLGDKKQEGTNIYIHSSYKKNIPLGTVKSKIKYQEGNKVSEETFYTNGQLKTAKTYQKGDNRTRVSSQKSYEKDGTFLGNLTYDNYYSYKDGFRFNGSTRTWYKDKRITKEIKYYYNTDTIFSKLEFNKITYFDKQRKVLGSLEVTVQNNYVKPFDGEQFESNGKTVSNITTYKKGKKTLETKFNNPSRDKKTRKTVTFYSDDEYPRKIKEIKYYSNGNKQKEITYKKGYKKQQSICYNKKGDQIGTYNYLTKTGTEYLFFYDSDRIRRIVKKEDGLIITDKKYKEVYNYKSADIKYYYPVIYDIDVNSIGQFFNTDGSLLFKITFKDQKPFNGVLLNDKRKEAFTFKNGVKEGLYRMFSSYKFPEIVTDEGMYHNGKREGKFQYYNTTGELLQTENFKEDLLDGKTTFYKDGKESSSLIYKAGKPFKGTFTKKHYSGEKIIKNYNDGFLTSETKTLKNDVKIHYTYSEKNVQTDIYYPNSDIKKYHFESKRKGSNISGELIRYNKKGKKMHVAQLRHGKFISGEIWLVEKYNYRLKEIAYYKLKKNSTHTDIKMLNNKDVVLFEAKEDNTIKRSILEDRLYVNILNITAEKLH